jgi:hypothetical protein
MQSLRLTSQYVVDLVERLVDLGSYFGTGQHDFARDEDQQDYFRLDHSVDQTRKQLQQGQEGSISIGGIGPYNVQLTSGS